MLCSCVRNGKAVQKAVQMVWQNGSHKTVRYNTGQAGPGRSGPWQYGLGLVSVKRPDQTRKTSGCWKI